MSQAFSITQFVAFPGILEWPFLLLVVFFLCILPLLAIASITLNDRIDKNSKVFWIIAIVVTNWLGVILFGFRYGFNAIFSFRQYL